MEWKVEYQIKDSLTRDEVMDVLTTALEGGVGYWACLDNTLPSWIKARTQVKEERGDDFYLEDVMIQVLQNGDKVEFIDAEQDPDDPKSERYWFDLEKFQKGCELYSKERGNIRKRLDDGDFDAIEADCLIQYACFGEIVFG